MIKYLNEEDNIEMDVQVGPHDEIDVSAEPEEAAPTQSMNPVDVAKSVPENIPIAAVHCDDENDAGNEKKLEFYVDARDVEKFADLNEFTMIDALNAIIHCHEEAGMRADNLVVVVGESTANYARNLEKHGGAYMFVHEADDISIDVQVGPNGEDMQVDADPQEANPVDAVKRDYGSVVVAKQGDEFFTDVEDVQKCAELNCESVIDTLNGIIRANEADCDISAQNLKVVVNENANEELIEHLQESGVDIYFLNEAKFHFLPKFKDEPKMKKYLGTLKEAERLLNSEGEITETTAHQFGNVALRVCDIIYNVGAVISLPMCLFIVPIPAYLVIRLISWGIRTGREAIVKAEGEKVLKKYNKLINKTSDEELKSKLTKQRDKLAKKLSSLDVEDDDED